MSSSHQPVVFRTDAGTKLHALYRHPVAFQIDSIDRLHRTGWSVLVQGVAHEAVPHELKPVDVEPWLGPEQHWIQLVSRHISGRRIRLPDIPTTPVGTCNAESWRGAHDTATINCYAQPLTARVFVRDLSRVRPHRRQSGTRRGTCARPARLIC